MNRTHEQLDNLGQRILNNSRTELYLSMRFMGVALNSLDYRMDLSTRTVGTDAVYIRFNPNYMMQLYLERPDILNRTYIHMLMHCIFRHMFHAKEYEDAELWDLCCDIAAESVVDSMDYPAIWKVTSDLREEWYGKLRREVHALTAEKLYHYFIMTKRDPYIEESLRQEFSLCDHGFWQRMRQEEPEQRPDDIGNQNMEGNGLPSGAKNGRSEETENKSENSAEDEHSRNSDQAEEGKQDGDGIDGGLNDQTASTGGNGGEINSKLNILSPYESELREEQWKENAKRMQSELETYAKDAAEDSGTLAWMLQIQNRKRTNYREFLNRFAVVREENRIDPDSFDYAFYMYGLSMYGNMPLVEENEYQESRKVETLVIAIDTSASCQEKLVQQFLNETASILRSQETFFHKIDVHIIECDNRVQKDIPLKQLDELEKYADAFEVRGGYGTDFRPVFSYVEDLQRRGELMNLKALMYFTDGCGIYPKTPTPYDTAFVFWKEEEQRETKVPSWALKLYVSDLDHSTLH